MMKIFKRNGLLCTNSEMLLRTPTYFMSKLVASEKNKDSNMRLDSMCETNEPWRKWWKSSFGKHPGKCNLPTVTIPERLNSAAKVFLNNCDKSIVSTVARKLENLLYSRRTCKEKNCVLYNHKASFFDKASKTLPRPSEKIKELVNSPTLLYKSIMKEKIKNDKVSNHQFQWKQVVYDKLNSAAYLVSRSPGCYASSLRVLNEIKQNIPDFKPTSFLNFGSGTGMCVWAVNSLWKNNLKQYYCIDSSSEMNDLAFFMFSGGNYDNALPGLFMRKVLPVSFQNNYDIVMSAYSLSELPSQKERLMILKMLWEKTRRFLVLIENGNFYGYYIIMEARNLLLQGLEGAEPTKAKKWSRAGESASVFAPCPHKMACPMWGTNSSCVFTQKYFVPEYMQRFQKIQTKTEKFSYVVFDKQCSHDSDYPRWPRVVSNPHVSKCVTCHVCTQGGTIEHMPISKPKYGADLCHVAKKSFNGDSLPLHSRNLMNETD